MSKIGEDDWVKLFFECTVHFIGKKKRIMSGAIFQSCLEILKTIPMRAELEEENASKLGNLRQAPLRKVAYVLMSALAAKPIRYISLNTGYR